MRRRQINPQQWLVVRDGDPDEGVAAARRLHHGSGVLVLGPLTQALRQRLRIIARLRSLTIVEERSGHAARVHDIRELGAALRAKTPLILLSPVFPTSSHPNWAPIPRMRAATLARLGGRKLVALGGMNRRRYAKIARLGFIGFAGISAFRT